MQNRSLENLNTISENLSVNSDKLKHHSDENEGISYCRGEFAKILEWYANLYMKYDYIQAI